MFFFFFFFFQAEDGIRDWSVTGVQTCALPISSPGCCSSWAASPHTWSSTTPTWTRPATACWPGCSPPPRSEERRVGKECRSRWSADHLKKKRERRVGVVDKEDGECRIDEAVRR